MAIQTKYDILQSYKLQGMPECIRDTWVNLGSAEITAKSKTFIKDMVYKINLGNDSGDHDSGDPQPATHGLNGALVLCESSLYSQDSVDWPSAVVEDEDLGYFSFSYGVITPHFRLLLTAEQLGAVTEPGDADFLPYMEIETANIVISEDELA